MVLAEHKQTSVWNDAQHVKPTGITRSANTYQNFDRMRRKIIDWG